MRIIIVFLLLIISTSCSNKRTIVLPEIQNTEISEVIDVSPAYIFYDESQPDSTLLNRKNLIGTTNWLINVDRRLSLRQAIPHIKFLQDKKRNAKMHKNDKAKNYFSCNALETKSLGFIEFTNVFFRDKNPDFVKFSENSSDDYLLIKIGGNRNVKLISLNQDVKSEVSEGYYLKDFEAFQSVINAQMPKTIILFFHQGLSFQDYITTKDFFCLPQNKTFQLSENEYLFY